MSHGKTVCIACGIVVAQCRCPHGHIDDFTTRIVCDNCKGTAKAREALAHEAEREKRMRANAPLHPETCAMYGCDELVSVPGYMVCDADYKKIVGAREMADWEQSCRNHAIEFLLRNVTDGVGPDRAELSVLSLEELQARADHLVKRIFERSPVMPARP